MSKLRLACLAAVALVACSSGAGTSGTSTGTFTGTGGAGTTTGIGTGGKGGDLFDAGNGGNTGTGGGATGGSYLIYASTDTTLFTLDPSSADLALTQVGTFDCIGSGTGQYSAMTDIAVDKSQSIWGITGHIIVPLTVEGSTVHCGTSIHLNLGGNPSPTFYALTFTPAGVLDPTKEVLVAGNSAGELWAIDPTGSVTQHGVFGTVPTDDGNGHAYPAANVGKPWELSGDIVFLANNGSPVGFATVRDCPNPPSTTGCSYTNTLLEIDVPALAAAGAQPVTKALRGQIVQKASGCSQTIAGDFGNLYGIAAWNDRVYGFSRSGKLVDIDTTNGLSCLVNNYPADLFSGAGVTTLAPVIPPPPIK